METIEDIVREMRSEFVCPMDGCGCSGLMKVHNEWANRIDAMASATARQIEEMAAENARLTDMYNDLNESYGELYMEKIRLLDALKPVLEVDMEKFGDGVGYGDCYEAVRNAQRIYREGEVK